MVLPEGRIEGDWLLRFAELRVCDGLSGHRESEVPVPFDAPSRQEAAPSPSFWWASQILERAPTMMNYHDPSKRVLPWGIRVLRGCVNLRHHGFASHFAGGAGTASQGCQRERKTTMAVKVSADDCVACGVCVDECPQQALTVEDICVVDEDACIDCGICVDSCPSDALSL